MKLNSVLMACLVAVFASMTVSEAAWADSRDRNHKKDGQGDRFALGLGAGIVQPDGEGEIYLTAGLRIRLWGEDGKKKRGKGRRDSQGIQAYLEPEVGYWERTDSGLDATDLYLGVNLVGVAPARVANYFFGVGFGFHSFDTDTDFDQDESRLGGNFHVGLDVNLGENVALFGVGRLDLLEGSEIDDVQTKIYGGLRFRF